jgi:hypothetical protein
VSHGGVQAFRKQRLDNGAMAHPLVSEEIDNVLLSLSELCEGGWAPVAHACNSSYSAYRDQEDRGSKPALGKIVCETLSLYAE